MSHYQDEDPCPVLFYGKDAINIGTVIDGLGLPKQNQPCKNGIYCVLLRQDISDYLELQDYKIPLADVPQFLLDIGPDPSLFTLIEARQVIRLPDWERD